MKVCIGAFVIFFFVKNKLGFYSLFFSLDMTGSNRSLVGLGMWNKIFWILICLKMQTFYPGRSSSVNYCENKYIFEIGLLKYSWFESSPQVWQESAVADNETRVQASNNQLNV